MSAVVYGNAINKNIRHAVEIKCFWFKTKVIDYRVLAQQCIP